MIFTIYGQEDSFSQFTVKNSFQIIQAQAVTVPSELIVYTVKLVSVVSQLPADLWIVEGIMSCFLKPKPNMDGSSSAFPKPFFKMKKNPK